MRHNRAMRFEFFLARELKMTRAELNLRLSASEFAHWIAFYQLEQHEQEQARQRAQDRANAQRLSRDMRTVR